MFIAKLSERQYCWRVFEDFHSQENIQFFDIYRCLFMCLHFSIGCYDRRRTARLRQGLHFSIASTLRSRQQILDPQVQELMAQVDTNFPKVRRKLLFSPLNQDAFSQPPRCFTGTSLLPFRLLLRPILKFWSIWGYADEDHLGKSFQAMFFWSRMSA